MVIIVNNSISFEFQAKMGVRVSLFTGFFPTLFSKKNGIVKKKILTFAFLQGIWSSGWLNYVAKKAPF
jgi:hypothetical protein